MTMTVEERIHATPKEKRNLYQQYSLEDEIERLAYHYDVPCDFFAIITGGKWHTYSGSVFSPGDSMTKAQERKLDIFARLMQLKPGMKILDVGSGWGGPLVYLCHQYGVQGVGITVTEKQISFSEDRARHYGVNAQFYLSHWETFEHPTLFDAIFTDEVVVHFNDLSGFFKKCATLLQPDGLVVNKELHLTHGKFKDWSDPLGVHVNKVYGFTGNYRLLQEEIDCAQQGGFSLREKVDIPMEHYHHTVQHHWIKNLIDNRDILIDMTSEQHVRDFYKYLRCTLVSFKRNVFEQNILSFQKASNES